MKLKSIPSDFHVEERTDIVPSEGAFAFYRLDKTNLTTPDAIAVIRRRWHLRFQDISFGGLKDRHAETSQYLTIRKGPPRELTDRGMKLSYLGHVAAGYEPANIRANFFRITVRDLSQAEVDQTRHSIATIQNSGVPNYFDDQRFGSVANGEFIARLMVLNRYEDAIKLALTAHYEFDKAGANREKQLLRDMWGRWEECLPRLRQGLARDIVTFLCREPENFRGAVRTLWPESQGLFLAAYQSYIWNRMLAALIRTKWPADQVKELPLKTGSLPTPVKCTNEQADQLVALTLPLPSARLRYDANAIWAPLVDEALRDQGFTLNQMELPGLRKPFFSKGDRAAFVRAADFMTEIESDERNANQLKLIVAFELPRGSYATMVIKHIFPSA